MIHDFETWDRIRKLVWLAPDIRAGLSVLTLLSAKV